MNKKDDPFYSPKLLLSGAREDIERFDSDWRDFHERCAGIPFEEFDQNTSERVLKFRVIPQVPDRLRVLASNAFNNLRHTLDQTVNCAAVELGGSRDNYFPFAKDGFEIDGMIKKNCRSVTADLFPTLKGFKPYGGGDDVLYTLSKLCGPNKHQIVLNLEANMPFAIDTTEKGWFRSFRGPLKFGPLAWDSDKQELEAARVGPGGDMQYQAMLNPPVFISFADSQIARGEPATAFLNLLISKVDGVLRAVEAETRRLKAARP